MARIFSLHLKNAQNTRNMELQNRFYSGEVT